MEIYFSSSDDFLGIMQKQITSIVSYEQISTGWTNFVFIATTKNSQYIFRFPRNKFFSNAILKEFEINKFLKNKISFKIPKMQLLYDNLRPFSMHKEISGTSLSFCYQDLSKEELNSLAKDVCKLLKEFSQIQTKGKNLQLVSNFLDNLSLVSQNDYNLSVHNEIKKMEEKHLIFSHGDLNPGNLILKNHKLYAVIDFAFAGISYDLVDLSRLLGRCPDEFKDILLNEYEKSFGKINFDEVEKLKKLWEYVEEKYILYMKQNCPDIILSNLV